MKLALIGDFNESVPAHLAIPEAIKLTKNARIIYQWLHTDEIDVNSLASFSGVWCVPASPYSNMNNVLAAIKFARVNDVPFLGTCGGYQHAALEFAQNELGYSAAENAEVNPQATMPLISSLSCRLNNEKKVVRLQSGSVIQSIYSKEQVSEEYYCGFGINTEYLHIFENSDMSFSGFDESGDPRALEIKKNRFFVGTAFQPERSAFLGKAHPLIQAFVQSIDTQ